MCVPTSATDSSRQRSIACAQLQRRISSATSHGSKSSPQRMSSSTFLIPMSTPPSECLQWSTAAALNPSCPDYMDHLTRRRKIWPYGLRDNDLPEGWLEWPRRADMAFIMQKTTRAFTRAEVAADIMRVCDYIANARAFGMRWLHVQFQSGPHLPRLTRAMYAVPERSGDASTGTGVCAEVTAAARARVRCNDAARLAARLISTSALHQRPRHLCRWAEVIIERVCSGYCQMVQATAAEVIGIGMDQGPSVQTSRQYSAGSLLFSSPFSFSPMPPMSAGNLSQKVAEMGATLQPLPLPPRSPITFSSSAMLATHHVPYPDPHVGRSSSRISHQLQQPRKR